MRTPVPWALAAVLAVVFPAVSLLGGCAQVVPGRAAAAPIPTPPTAEITPTAKVAAPSGAGSAAVAAATTASLQEFWTEAFPAAFDQQWRDIDGFVPVRSGDGPPPCVDDAAAVEGQAYYCPAADVVVWDADGLLPALHEEFGPAGVTVVLAHEIGHAVQTRLGIDEAQAADPQRYPTILLEAMADCYAGVALAHLTRQPVAGLPAGPVERDEALLALVGFRDPLGVEPGDDSAHGNAFDRVSAFQDGWTDGATRCAGMTLDNRAFTQRRFGSAADRARGGDLPLPRLLAAVESDARGWFTTLGAARAPGWTAPPLTGGTCPSDQGPVRFCDGAVDVDRDALGVLHRDLGDYAGATLVAGRYGLAALAAAGDDVDDSAAGAAAVCLAGAYTGRLLDPDGAFSLSPGDLDEAVQVLLTDDWAARAADGRADPFAHGFERVGLFRTGLTAGAAACLPG